MRYAEDMTNMTSNLLRFKNNEAERLKGYLAAAVADVESEMAAITRSLADGTSVSVLNLLPKTARVHEVAVRLNQLTELLAELKEVGLGAESSPGDGGA